MANRIWKTTEAHYLFNVDINFALVKNLSTVLFHYAIYRQKGLKIKTTKSIKQFTFPLSLFLCRKSI